MKNGYLIYQAITIGWLPKQVEWGVFDFNDFYELICLHLRLVGILVCEAVGDTCYEA